MTIDVCAICDGDLSAGAASLQVEADGKTGSITICGKCHAALRKHAEGGELGVEDVGHISQERHRALAAHVKDGGAVQSMLSKRSVRLGRG